MNRLIQFIRSIYVFVIFIVLEILAVNHYSNSTNYSRAKLLSASNYVIGGVHKKFSDVGDYFRLRSENDALIERIARLQMENDALRNALPDEELEMEDMLSKYYLTSAAVINNTITRQKNYITIDKGTRDGVRTNMALITPEGTLVGYVLNCTDNFSIAISVLNTEFRTGGNIRGKDYFGSIHWDGFDNGEVTLTEVPKYADIAVGDTIVTGYSSIFPEGVLIGTVESFELMHSTYYDARVKLATRMGRLKKLLVVDYADIQERMMLEEDYFDTPKGS